MLKWTSGAAIHWTFSSPTVRSWFELTPDRRAVTDGFFVADMVIVGASIASAWAIRARRPWAVVAVAFTTGLILYPTAYLVAWVATTDGPGVAGLWIMIPPALINPWVLTSLAVAVIALLAWMGALSLLDLSRAYPFVSASFVLVLICSAIFFGEALTAAKVIGALLIVAGLIVGSQG